MIFFLYGWMWMMAGCESREDVFLLEEEADAEIQTETEDTGAASAIEPEDTEASEAETVYVFVCGQVRNPGVYSLEPGSRVCDAIRLAGGCLETADFCAVNQAEVVVDGSRIYIPAIGEQTAEEAAASSEDGLVHLNQATREELMTLSGIGETKADAILEYREAHGGFTTKEELMNIPGIKEGVFRNIQDDITVE